MQVALLRWPDEERRLLELRSASTPRLLFVEPGGEPPASDDCLEDWVRVPVDERELRCPGERPHCPGRASRPPARDGRRRTAPLRRPLGRPPSGRAGADGRARRTFRRGRGPRLAHASPPGLRTGPRRNALDVHMSRLRRRIAPLGLAIRTVSGPRLPAPGCRAITGTERAGRRRPSPTSSSTSWSC